MIYSLKITNTTKVKRTTEFNPFEDFIRVKLDIQIPSPLSKEDFALAWKALNVDAELPPAPIRGIEQVDESTRWFVEPFIRLYQQFCLWGAIPQFSLPQILTVQPKSALAEKFEIQLKVRHVFAMSPKMHHHSFAQAHAVCHWLAQNRYNTANLQKAFQLIDAKVIQVLKKSVPSRKSTIPVLKAAHQRGIPMFHLGHGTYQLGWGSRARYLQGSISDRDSMLGAYISNNKSNTAVLLRTAGLPAPEHLPVSSLPQAKSAAQKLGFPLVIKPADQDRGIGVVVDVMDIEQVESAFAMAKQHSKHGVVLVERQVQGVCHRVFVVAGRLLYAVKRMPMSVQGDGRRTVAQLVSDALVEESKTPPWDRSGLQPLDDLALAAMGRLGLQPDSVPEPGVWVPLRRIESTQWGGVDEDMTQTIHPDNVDIAIKAARLLNLDHAGIDIITADITRPWHQTGAIINEVNVSPLLGGAAISRSYLPRFFEGFVEGDGKIPLRLFETEQQAKDFQREQFSKGLRCYLTGPDETCDQTGRPVQIVARDLRGRIRALVMRADVDAIAVWGLGGDSDSDL
jgi:cyanophycin synthetase